MIAQKFPMLVYKSIFPDGSQAYETKCNGLRVPLRGREIDYVARYMRDEANHVLHQSKDDATIVSIDFQAFHDILLTAGDGPRRCFPLSPRESEDFWKHFIIDPNK